MRRPCERGISLIEATIVLTIVSILAAVAAPSASRTIDNARLTRALSDTAAIRTAIHTLVVDYTDGIPFATNGSTNSASVEMLVSDGDIPALGGGTATWVTGIQGDNSDGTVEPDVDFLENHLVLNTPRLGGSYLTTLWRGAYINAPIDADPWGNRYAVNVQHLRAPGTVTNDTFVMSAGPDEEADTTFTVNGARPGDDDIINVVRRDSLDRVVP